MPLEDAGRGATMGGVDTALLVLGLTLVTALGARRLRTPMPIVLAIVGIAVGSVWRFIPWLSPLEVPPERVLFVFLPPLLTTAAFALPFGAFRRNLLPIGMLAIGLVLATMAAAAAVAHVAIGLPWAAALVLGAIVAPPDPVAATSVGQQTGLAHRLVVILEGEGLVNDAIAIVAYHLAIVAATTGHFSWTSAALAVVREAPTGVAVGLAMGWLVARVRRGLDDVTLEAGISLFVPYLTYEIADRIGASAVLAVVTLGFMLQRHAAEATKPAARLAARTVWGAVRFASTALVFLLLGLLNGEVVGTPVSRALLLAGVAVTAAVIALRFVWMLTVPHLARLIGAEERRFTPTRRELTVLGWAGMRGVVSLALALALPVLPTGAGDDARHAILFITFAVIVGTLVLQGATLLPLVTRLGAGDPEREARDETRVRERARAAGLAALDRVVRAEPALASRCRVLAERVTEGTVGIAAAGIVAQHPEEERPIERALAAQRAVVTGMRDTGQISEALAERLITELDVDAMAVQGDVARLTGTEES